MASLCRPHRRRQRVLADSCRNAGQGGELWHGDGKANLVLRSIERVFGVRMRPSAEHVRDESKLTQMFSKCGESWCWFAQHHSVTRLSLEDLDEVTRNVSKCVARCAGSNLEVTRLEETKQ
jgi:hypothetical protein